MRIGIYGGTFSPPHMGHFHAVSAFLAQEKPDRMLIIPACVPPHKLLSGDATPENRMEMCRLAFAEIPSVTVSDMEIRRGGKSYTVLTLRELACDEDTSILLCGADMFLSLDTWYCAPEIFRLAEIVYAERQNNAEQARLSVKADFYRTRYGATVRPLAFTPVEISSSILRTSVAKGEDTTRYLNPKVRRYIDQCHLYRK